MATRVCPYSRTKNRVYELVYEYVKNKVDLSAIRGLVTPSFRVVRVFRSYFPSMLSVSSSPAPRAGG
jgi:hypothetical protein